MNFVKRFLEETQQIARAIDYDDIESLARFLASTKGRLFILGVGGSAANAGHAVNDFRKISGIEAYAPTDNVAELTARTNDDGWDTTFEAWLKVSRLAPDDTILVLSVSGGNETVSGNIVKAVLYAKTIGSKVLGIVGRSNSVTAKEADALVMIPFVSPEHVTPHAEAWQAILLHLLVSHPLLRGKHD
jgi:D-sedoheptulose 7-phosphate isomerase